MNNYGYTITWPDHVDYALNELGYEYPYDEVAVKAFLDRWGALDLETFSQVLTQTNHEDRLLAIFAIGYKDTPWARNLLMPFLESSSPLERWAAALCLGRMKEERTLPILCTMLTEYLPPHEQYNAQGDFVWYYDYWRSTVVKLLGEWERPELVIPLYEALNELWRQEQTGTEFSKKDWYVCQDLLAHALGRLARFDLVKGLDASEARLSLWKVYMALGYLQAHQDYPDVFAFYREVAWNKPPLKAQVAEVLQQHLGLSSQDQEVCLQLATYERAFRGVTMTIEIHRDGE
jgi:HEAT repeats